jgi:erythromycin esterase-like protein
LFASTGILRFWLDLRSARSESLRGPLLQRAIGVIYRPETERWSHYFQAHLDQQFDVMIHLDETRALQPLEQNPQWERGDLPETFPSGV